MNRHELTDDQWARIQPLLPPMRSGRPGRPYHDHRRIVNGMLWLAKAGVPWRETCRNATESNHLAMVTLAAITMWL
jgi:transposase